MFQLVGIYDGTQEVQTALRTQYRPVVGQAGTAVPLKSFPASLSDLPGAGVNPALLAFCIGGGLLVFAAGFLVGRRKW